MRIYEKTQQLHYLKALLKQKKKNSKQPANVTEEKHMRVIQ